MALGCVARASSWRRWRGMAADMGRQLLRLTFDWDKKMLTHRCACSAAHGIKSARGGETIACVNETTTRGEGRWVEKRRAGVGAERVAERIRCTGEQQALNNPQSTVHSSQPGAAHCAGGLAGVALQLLSDRGTHSRSLFGNGRIHQALRTTQPI